MVKGKGGTGQTLVGSGALAETHAVQLGRLLRGLAVTLNEVRYDTGELLELAISALDHGADRADMLAIAGEMLRLR